MKKSVHLGFEVGTGEEVSIPLGHMVVTGQSQLAGKTTTLEALVERSGAPAIAFVTKRGEASFASARRVLPYFKDQADWPFVEALLEASQRQRMKFERAWLIKAAKNAKTLADVRRNARELQDRSRRSMDADIFMLLGEYLDRVLPQLSKLPTRQQFDFKGAVGLRVMDLEKYSTEVQSLIIRTVLEQIYEKESGVITVIPEAWEFVPQGRSTPVRAAAEALVRKGANLRNFVWFDSQDIAGVDKTLLRSATVWLLGAQRERNEVKRAIEQIPGGVRKPKPDDVAGLRRGQFFACTSAGARLVYVRPSWLDAHVAREIALGRGDADGASRGDYGRSLPAAGRFEDLDPRPMLATEQTEQLPELRRSEPKDDDMTQEQEDKLDRLLDGMEQILERQGTVSTPPTARVDAPAGNVDMDAIYREVRARLMKEAPTLIKLVTTKPELHVREERREVSFEDGSLKAKIAALYMRGWFKEPRKAGDVFKELTRLGHKTANPRVWEAMKEMATLGLFFVEDNAYSAQPDVKVVVER